MALACACALDSPTITLEEMLKSVTRFIRLLVEQGRREKSLQLCDYLIEFWRREGLEGRVPEFTEVMRELKATVMQAQRE